jgi:hypothetical protein
MKRKTDPNTGAFWPLPLHLLTVRILSSDLDAFLLKHRVVRK